MNLHAIASPIIAAVNPQIIATLKISAGYTTQDDGSRVPRYLLPYQSVAAQVQALTFRDLQQLDGLNIEGVRCAIYLYGKVDGVVRPTNKGGDLIVIDGGAHAGTYLVAQVLEQWPDWVKCACTLQNNS